MRTSLLIGLLLKYIIVLLPAILVLFSRRVSTPTKIKWFLAISITSYLLKSIVGAVIIALQRDIIVIIGPIILGGFAPLIPFTWYFVAWMMYLSFLKKYGSLKTQRNAKIISLVLISILTISLLYKGIKMYGEAENKAVLTCGKEKIFTKNFESNNLYLTKNNTYKGDIEYIGKLDRNSIILKDDFEDDRQLNHCLKYSKKLKLIYPKNSKFNKKWKWEKYTLERNSTLVFSSNEKFCTPNKNDGIKKYEYRIWQNKNEDKSISLKKGYFIFKDIENKIKRVKAETPEFSIRSSTKFSTIDNKYVFITSINDSSKIILWKFSKNGNFQKEIHINIPDTVVMELNKSYYISHIKIDKDKILFRLYESHWGTQKQEFRIMCSYKLIEVDISIDDIN